MRTTLEFDADNPEEMARVLDTVIHLAKALELPIPAEAGKASHGLPQALINHIRFRITAPRQHAVQDICAAELAERKAIFKPAPNSGAINLFLPDVPDASYTRVHPSRAVLRLSPQYADHPRSRAMTSDRTAYGVAVDTTSADGVAEFHRLAGIAAEKIRKEFGRD